jgi:hypothetical protein
MSQRRIEDLDLRQLALGIGVITPEFGAVMAQGAAVALEAQGHVSARPLDIEGHWPQQLLCRWQPCDEMAVRTFRDLDIATNFGSEGIAVMLVARCLGLDVVDRSVKGTGFDYWLGSMEKYPFQYRARLEVSGIANGDASQVRARVKQKLGQTDASDSTRLTAYVIVVEFSRPVCQFVKK